MLGKRGQVSPVPSQTDCGEYACTITQQTAFIAFRIRHPLTPITRAPLPSAHFALLPVLPHIHGTEFCSCSSATLLLTYKEIRIALSRNEVMKLKHKIHHLDSPSTGISQTFVGVFTVCRHTTAQCCPSFPKDAQNGGHAPCIRLRRLVCVLLVWHDEELAKIVLFCARAR